MKATLAVPALVAPQYRPAEAFHQPTPAPFEFGVETLSIGEFLETPALQKILIDYAPWAIHMASSDHFQPFHSTFALRDMAFFIPMDLSKSLAAVDAALKQLPKSEWPQHVR
jgi:hypothetical protein